MSEMNHKVLSLGGGASVKDRMKASGLGFAWSWNWSNIDQSLDPASASRSYRRMSRQCLPFGRRALYWMDWIDGHDTSSDNKPRLVRHFNLSCLEVNLDKFRDFHGRTVRTSENIATSTPCQLPEVQRSHEHPKDARDRKASRTNFSTRKLFWFTCILHLKTCILSYSKTINL